MVIDRIEQSGLCADSSRQTRGELRVHLCSLELSIDGTIGSGFGSWSDEIADQYGAASRLAGSGAADPATANIRAPTPSCGGTRVTFASVPNRL